MTHSIPRSALVPLFALALAGTATAQDDYAGVSIGRSDYRIDTTGAASADTRDTAGKVFIGRRFTPHLGAEVALFDLGRASGSVAVPGAGTVGISARTRGIGAYGVLSAPAGPVTVSAKAGLAHVRTRMTTSVATGLPGSESSWQPALGLGVTYDIDRQFALRGEWERTRARFPGGERDSIDLVSVGLLARF